MHRPIHTCTHILYNVCNIFLYLFIYCGVRVCLYVWLPRLSLVWFCFGSIHLCINCACVCDGVYFCAVPLFVSFFWGGVAVDIVINLIRGDSVPSAELRMVGSSSKSRGVDITKVVNFDGGGGGGGDIDVLLFSPTQAVPYRHAIYCLSIPRLP